MKQILLLLICFFLTGCSYIPSFKEQTTTHTGVIVDVNATTITVDIDGNIQTYEIPDTTKYTKKSTILVTLDNNQDLHSIDIIDAYEMDDYLNDILASMTLEEKVGQLFLVRYDTENAQALLIDYHIGGIIFFAKDFYNETKDSV